MVAFAKGNRGMSGKAFEKDLYECVVELARRRGFFWQSYEIYGGVAGFYDLGPLGVRLKNKIVELWRYYFIQRHQDIVVEVETPVIGPARVYEASGHVEHFTDPIVECLKCGRKFRADHLVEDKLGIKVEGVDVSELTKIIHEHGIACPVCGGELGEAKLFNLLFKTTIGPYSENIGYLRPETAQGMFTNFKKVYEIMRKKLPLGIAQIGRVARNEISPRQGMIRLREFTIAEVEFFFDPEEPDEDGILSRYMSEWLKSKLLIITAEARKRGEEKPEEFSLEEIVREKIVATPWLAYWMVVAKEFVKALGVAEHNIVFEEKLPEERAHYALQTFDQLVKVSRWGWIEVSGHAYRTDYDLSRHMKYSGQDLRAFKQYKKPRTVKKKIVIVDKAWLGRTFRSKTPEIMKLLEQVDVEEVEKAIAKGRPVKVGGFEIPLDKIRIVEKVEKITGKHFLPHVVEPSFGVERLVYVTLEYAYSVKEDRVVLKLPRYLAPIEAAVFPLVQDERLIKVARELYHKLVKAGFYVVYDDSGSIGRRYARVDEIGVPVAITVDFETIENNTVTLRDRDTWKQVRIDIDRVVEAVRKFIYEGAKLEELGQPVKSR